MFQKARIRLTFWYLVIIMGISLIFSSAIYRIVSSELDRMSVNQRLKWERRMAIQSPFFDRVDLFRPYMVLDTDILVETKQRFIFILFLLNTGILTTSSILGYLLAGRTLKPIKEMVDNQNRFMSDASHEFKTPLTALKTSLEVALRDKKLTIGEARKLTKESIEEVDRLKLMTENLLQLTKSENIGISKVNNKTSLNKAIDLVIKRLNPLAKDKKIKIINKAKDIEVSIDEQSLVTVMTIIIDNAIKYSREKNSVIIDSIVQKDRVIVSVIDKGIGIGEKDIPYIFERFYRADTARKKIGQGGYGLGLSIAKKILERNKGLISLESKEDKGTICKMTILK